MSRIYEFKAGWPPVRRVQPKEVGLPEPPAPIKRNWVIVLATGEVAYVHHTKPDGSRGVRPVDRETGLDLPSEHAHWSEAQRRLIPREYSLKPADYRTAVPSEYPRAAEGYAP